MSEIELHRKLLGDKVRNDAFGAALARVVKPGMTVADIGAGTGFLSFLARRLGAAHCYLYEYTGALELAKELARRNGITGLTFVGAHSTEVRKPPKVDVVVSETLGNFALEEGMLESLVDARRFLNSGGTLMPIALAQFAAPVVSGRLQDEIDVFKVGAQGLDLGAARDTALNNMYVKKVTPDDLPGRAAACCWDEIAFTASGKPPSSQRKGAVGWDKLGDATVHGFALWWEVELVKGITLSTSPFAPATHWEQVYLPMLEPIRLARGEQLNLSLSSNTREGVRVIWEARVQKDGKQVSSQRQDLARGRL